MPKMLAELYADPDSGFLGHRLTLASGGPFLVQYWSSHDALYDYASAQDAVHRPAWTEFNRRARKAPGVVGIWHETFQVERAESIYVSMPVTGLAKATTAVPVGRGATRPATATPPGSPPPEPPTRHIFRVLVGVFAAICDGSATARDGSELELTTSRLSIDLSCPL